PPSSCDGTAPAGRCAGLRPGDVPDDGGRVPAPGAVRRDAGVAGGVRADDRRGEEVRGVGHPGAGRLERGAPPRGPAERRAAAEAGTGQRVARGRRDAADGAGGDGADRRVRAPRAPLGRWARTNTVRRALEAARAEARKPAGAPLGGGGDALRAAAVAAGVLPGLPLEERLESATPHRTLRE